MSWVIEQLHRDGSVTARLPIPAPTTDAVVRIGRALDNDLVLDDPHCAAYHARLEIDAGDRARLVDLETSNGIVAGRKRRAAVHDINDDTPYRLGNTQIRVRSSTWPVAAEISLVRRAVWPLALLAVAAALGYGGWDLWLGHVQEQAPKYFYDLGLLALSLCVWSAVYALYGRLITGAERFFSHLAIASTGFLCANIVLKFFDMLAFSMSWLWPVQITEPTIVIVAALTVRFHLRLADPRHWPTMRIAVVAVAACAIAIPLIQKWVLYGRLTDVQTVLTIQHPALRIAQPVTIDEITDGAVSLKERVDRVRKSKDGDTQGWDYSNVELP